MIITRQDNFLDKEKCNQAINFFITKSISTKKYRDTITLQCIDPHVLNKVNNCFNIHDFSERSVSNMEIVQWPVGSKMEPHKDIGDKFSFLIYLNDNFKGGETIIDGITIKPKQGRLVLFSNGYYEHEVTEVTDGIRYTLIAWYK